MQVDEGEGEHVATLPQTQSIRRLLSKLRAEWAAHSPATPIYLEAELEPGITIFSFCVDLFISQRNRRSRS